MLILCVMLHLFWIEARLADIILRASGLWMNEFLILGLVEACACCLTRKAVVSWRRSLVALGPLTLDLLLVVVFLPEDSTPNSGCNSPLNAFIFHD